MTTTRSSTSSAEDEPSVARALTPALANRDEQMEQIVRTVLSPTMIRLNAQMEQITRTALSPTMIRLNAQMEQIANAMGPRLIGDLVTHIHAMDDLAGPIGIMVGTAEAETATEPGPDGRRVRNGQFELELIADVIAAWVSLWLFYLCLWGMNRSTPSLEAPDPMQTLQSLTWSLGMGALVRQGIRRAGKTK